MQANAVKVPVVAPVSIECEFWPENGGWKGSCSELKITVDGNGFEDAKKNMESALTTKIKAVLPSRAVIETDRVA